MLGIAPRPGHNTSPSANGATHPFTAWRSAVAGVGCAGLWHGPSALVWGWRSVPGALPQAGMRPRRWRWPPPCISGPKARSIPAWGIAPCCGHRPMSCGASPHAPDTTKPRAPTARPICSPHGGSAVADVDCAGLWHGPSALAWGWRSVPGAFPQAGMRPRRWRWHGRGSKPCSVPYIRFVIFDPVLLEEHPELVLKCSHLMMRLLFVNVCTKGIQIRWTHGEAAVAALPGKSREVG